MRFRDLTGKRFKNFIALYRSEDLISKDGRRRVRWRCLCDCGNEFDALSDNILRRQDMTCPECANKRRSENNRTDVIGNKYGRLTVIDILWNGNRAKVVCKCDCGNDYIGDKSDVVSGHTKSCGCLWKEAISMSNTKDWTGHISDYGAEFIEQAYINDKGQWMWRCKCGICHDVFVALPAKVNNGEITSCGCRAISSGEAYIASFLNEKNITFIPQYTFNDCRFINLLRFDFAIMNNNQLLGIIEYDGKQHFEPIDFFGGQDAFEITKKRDNIKNEYCSSHNIPLLRITYNMSTQKIREKIYEYYLSLTTAGCA